MVGSLVNYDSNSANRTVLLVYACFVIQIEIGSTVDTCYAIVFALITIVYAFITGFESCGRVCVRVCRVGALAWLNALILIDVKRGVEFTRNTLNL